MDTISPERRRENMRRIRGKDTKVEVLVRRLTHSLGYRYRLHSKSLPGKPDMVFQARRKAIFVHGCFWHQHDDSQCKITRVPKSNLSYWVPKLERTKIRDSQNQGALRDLGWDILVIWECESYCQENLTSRIRDFLG